MLNFSNEGDSKGTVILPIEEYHRLYKERKEAVEEKEQADSELNQLLETAKDLNRGAEEISKFLSMIYKHMDGVQHWVNQFNETSSFSELRIDEKQETIKVKLLANEELEDS